MLFAQMSNIIGGMSLLDRFCSMQWCGAAKKSKNKQNLCTYHTLVLAYYLDPQSLTMSHLASRCCKFPPKRAIIQTSAGTRNLKKKITPDYLLLGHKNN